MANEGPKVTPDDYMPALHYPVHDSKTDIIDSNNGNPPNARYPRSSHENEVNRFYVESPETAGDMRAVLVRGETFAPFRPEEKGTIKPENEGKNWDKGMDTKKTPKDRG